MKIEEQLDYDDVLLQFYTACQQYGARKVLQDFRENFEDMFEEILLQGNRVKSSKQTPALFKPNVSSM